MEKVILSSFNPTELKELIKSCLEEILVSQQNAQPASSDWLCLEEATRFLNIAKPTLYAYTSKRLIPFHKKGKKLLFFREDLEKWLREGKKDSLSEIKEKVWKGGKRYE